MAIDLESTIEYYKNLLIIQYNNKEKARATIDLNVRTLLNDNIACQVQDAYDLETAIGVQLDVLGKYVGINRFFSNTLLIGNFFSMTSYSTLSSDDKVGMTNYANYATDPGGFADYSDITDVQKLSDDDYRFVMKLRIVQNNSNHSNKSIDDGLFSFFGGDVILSDNQNMTIVYFVNPVQITRAKIALTKGVLPRPIGVRLNGLIEKTEKIFGFTNYNRTVISTISTGLTDYTQGFTKIGETLNYIKVIEA
jgi:hypothetical protein